jgi:hypothetical protein
MDKKFIEVKGYVRRKPVKKEKKEQSTVEKMKGIDDLKNFLK